jgi:hypothetical protein
MTSRVHCISCGGTFESCQRHERLACAGVFLSDPKPTREPGGDEKDFETLVDLVTKRLGEELAVVLRKAMRDLLRARL